MSYINIRSAANLKSTDGNKFFGLNRTESVVPGEFSNMKNMTARNYPFISTREPRELSKEFNRVFVKENGETVEEEVKNIRAVIAPREDTEAKGFTGVIGQSFYYNGEKKSFRINATYTSDGKYDYGMEIAPDGKVQLLWANRVVIIHGYDCAGRNPYTYYYDTDDEGGEEDYVKSGEYDCMGSCEAHEMSISGQIGTITIIYETKTPEKDEKHWNFKVGDPVFVDGVMTYSDSRWKKPKTNEAISATVVEYTETVQSKENFSAYEWTIKLSIMFYNLDGESPFEGVYTTLAKHVYKKIPYMTRLCLHKGRLWGANPNGEYVYASALGDLFQFNKFEGLNDDSIYLESSTQGGYLGVISCGDSIAVFKKNELEIIYGELPSEIAVGKRYKGYGCADIDSCTIIDNVLYYMGFEGFYIWSGSTPQLISKKLDTKYEKAFGYTDGKVYYVSAKGKVLENISFDTRCGLWYKGDEDEVRGYFKIGDEGFIVSDDKIYKEKSGTEKVDWYIESVRYFPDSYSEKTINEVWLKVKASGNTKISFLVSGDGRDFKECPAILENNKESAYRTYRIPIRPEECSWWKYKIKGSGDCIILGLEIIKNQGGRIYNNERAIQ